MNKFAKGSLAAGAGVVLLLGGAGTLAYWNSEVDLTGGTINAGELSLTADQDAFQESGLTTWVPGDEHTYATTLTLVAQGDNIAGEIALDEGSLTFYDADAVAQPSLAEKFDIEFAPVGDLADGLSYNDEKDIISFSQEGEYTVDVELTVELPFGDTDDNDTQGASIDLAQTSFTATQLADGAGDGSE